MLINRELMLTSIKWSKDHMVKFKNRLIDAGGKKKWNAEWYSHHWYSFTRYLFRIKKIIIIIESLRAFVVWHLTIWNRRKDANEIFFFHSFHSSSRFLTHARWNYRPAQTIIAWFFFLLQFSEQNSFVVDIQRSRFVLIYYFASHLYYSTSLRMCPLDRLVHAPSAGFLFHLYLFGFCFWRAIETDQANSLNNTNSTFTNRKNKKMKKKIAENLGFTEHALNWCEQDHNGIASKELQNMFENQHGSSTAEHRVRWPIYI